MTEWGVVGVIVALAGLVVTLVRPMISLTKSITQLTTVVDRLKNDVEDTVDKNHESHRRIWAHNDEQDKTLTDHEKRIGFLEHK